MFVVDKGCEQSTLENEQLLLKSILMLQHVYNAILNIASVFNIIFHSSKLC